MRMYTGGLTTRDKELKYEVERFMKKRIGLDFFDVVFETLDGEGINETAAYGGFPNRYPHWRFGMEYEKLQKGYTYGLQKIYEMVINNVPCYAYLLSANSAVDQKIVMAHVYAHCDFFKNNVHFNHTNRKAVDMFADHKARIKEFEKKYGETEVGEWLDRCLSLENLIDGTGLRSGRQQELKNTFFDEKTEKEESSGRLTARENREYMDRFLNPEKELQKYQEEQRLEKERQKDIEERGLVFPSEPVADVMNFLAREAPLENWQRELLLIIRDEAYYFFPQGLTKITNEGWAAYCHSWAMTQGLCEPSEIVDYADHHTGTIAMRPGTLNPYKIGMEIFRDIEWRYDSGRHGAVYENCDIKAIYDDWDHCVAFKIISDDYAGDGEMIKRKFGEFLCFWKAVKSGNFRFPQGIYNTRLLLRHWNFYNNADFFLKELRNESRDYAKEYSSCSSTLKNAKADNNQRAEKHFALEVALIKKDVVHCRSIEKLFFTLKKIAKAFQDGELEPETFYLPHEFHDYFRRFPLKVDIGKGVAQAFHVRKFYKDESLIDEFLTEELCESLKLFTFAPNDEMTGYEIKSRRFRDIKRKLILQLINLGQPDIRVESGNYNNGGELLFRHYNFIGIELRTDYVQDTLNNIFDIWKRPVHIETIADGKNIRYSYDGKQYNHVTF